MILRIYLALLIIFTILPSASFAQTFAYITNNSSNNVSVINVASQEVIATVDVGNSPGAVAATPDGKFVYVANTDSNNVSVIEVSTNTVKDTVPVGTNPNGIASSPDGMFVFVTNNRSGDVSVIETTTNTFVESIQVGQQPEGIAFSNDSAFAYAVNITDSVSVINVSSMETVNTIENVGDEPILIAVNPVPNSATAYVSDINSDSLTELDLSSDTVSDTINLSNNRSGDSGDVVVTSDGSTIYVSFAGIIAVVDTATKMVTDTIGVNADCLGITPDGQSLYACEIEINGPNFTNFARIIDLSTNTVVDSVTVGMDPSGVAFASTTPEVDAPEPQEPGTSNNGNGSCALSNPGQAGLSFPLYLLIPAVILFSRLRRKIAKLKS